MVLDLELCAKFSDHSVVEIGTIISDDPLRDVVTINEVILNESSYCILGN